MRDFDAEDVCLSWDGDIIHNSRQYRIGSAVSLFLHTRDNIPVVCGIKVN